jgi:hypothetical protein
VTPSLQILCVAAADRALQSKLSRTPPGVALFHTESLTCSNHVWSSPVKSWSGSPSTVDMDELKQVWRAKAKAELAELRQAQAKFDELKALPLIVLPD